MQHSPDAILIIVTNPLDAMCHVALARLRLPARARARDGRRARLGALPDVHRRRSWASSVEDTHAFVLGGHGDTMVPLSRYSTVAGVPITELLPPDRVEALEERTRQRRRRGRRPAQDRLGLLRAGRLDVRDGRVDPARSQARPAVRGPARRASSATDGLFVGVPVVLGAGGMERDLRDRADGRRAGRLRRVGGRRPGAGRQARLKTPVGEAGPGPRPRNRTVWAGGRGQLSGLMVGQRSVRTCGGAQARYRSRKPFADARRKIPGARIGEHAAGERRRAISPLRRRKEEPRCVGAALCALPADAARPWDRACPAVITKDRPFAIGRIIAMKMARSPR